MNKRTLAAGLALSLALFGAACQKAETTASDAAQTSSASAPSSPGSSNPESGESKVTQSAERWTGKLPELLTLEMAASASGYPAAEAKEDYNQTLKNPSTHSISYRWDKGRKQTIVNPALQSEITVPVKDTIELSWVEDTTLQKFKANYRTPTAEELAHANAAVSQKLSEMEAEGKVTSEQAKLTKGLGGNLGSGLSFTEVDGVGDYSVWNNKDKVLKVFYQGLMFQIRVDITSDEEVNRQKSIEVARQVIEKSLKS